MLIKKNSSIDLEEFKLESLGNQMAILRKYLCDKYYIQYISSYLIIEEREKVMLMDTNADGEVDITNIDREAIRNKFNKKGLKDSKTRGIKSRYSIPMTVKKDKRILIILEDKKFDRFISKEMEILQEIEEIFDSLN